MKLIRIFKIWLHKKWNKTIITPLENDYGYEIAHNSLKYLRKYKDKITLNKEDIKFHFLLTSEEKDEIIKNGGFTEEINNKLKLKWLEIVDDMIFFFEYSISPTSFLKEDENVIKMKKTIDSLEKKYKKAGLNFITYFREIWT